MFPFWYALLSVAFATGSSINVGKPALLFSLPVINENIALELVSRPQIALTDFTGIDPIHPSRAVVLFFYDKDHGGADLQLLNQLHNRYDRKRVQFIGIDGTTGSSTVHSSWVEKQRLDFPVLRDNHGVVLGRYSTTGLPMTVITNGEGDIVAVERSTGEALSGAIEGVLRGRMDE